MLRKYKKLIWLIILVSFIIVITIISLSITPDNFPRGTIIKIPKDMSISQAANLLQEKGIIRSSLTYKIYVVIMRDGKGIQAGTYLFDEQQSSLRVAYRTGYGITNIQKIKITIPEGSNSKEIANIIKKLIPSFDKDTFLPLAKLSEGYLFPDTYFFDSTVSPNEVVTIMKVRFNEEILSLKSMLATSTKSLSDIIIMASIIEEEANNTKDRQIISGILWKRLEQGMLLQVDAPFYYLLGKGSSQLTKSDLAAASGYNTYVNKGLPVGPISNPGLNAIQAALNPNKTNYFFYLADRKGVTHYAVTHDSHVENKWRYLQ